MKGTVTSPQPVERLILYVALLSLEAPDSHPPWVVDSRVFVKSPVLRTVEPGLITSSESSLEMSVFYRLPRFIQN
jgi:hypothetical protein